MLFLEGNQLTALPAELFTCLDKLVWLDVRNNKLTSIPETIVNHQCLETILLQENQIEKLPVQLGKYCNKYFNYSVQYIHTHV